MIPHNHFGDINIEIQASFEWLEWLKALLGIINWLLQFSE